jgi:hypothetical protein
MLPQPPEAPSSGLPVGGTLDEAVAMTFPPPVPTVVLAVASLARRRSDQVIGGQMRRARHFRKPAMAVPATSCPPNGQLRDPTMVVGGLGSLSLPPLGQPCRPEQPVATPIPQAPLPLLPAMIGDVYGDARGYDNVRNEEDFLSSAAQQMTRVTKDRYRLCQ